MKVILISRVAKLGSVGDVVTVKDGYAKNFLIPQKKAIFYNAANYKTFEARKQQFEAQNYTQSSAAEDYKIKLNGKNIIILGNASDFGSLYGSITTATIATKVNEFLGSKVVSRIDVLLKKPIKEIGVHDVKIELYSGIVAEIKVIVSRSESEVENLLAKYLADESKSGQNKSEKQPKESKAAAIAEDDAGNVEQEASA